MTKENINVKYSKPWWNDECDRVIKEKHRARNKFRKHPTDINYHNYKVKESIASDVVKKSKSESFKKFCSTMSSETPLKLVWNNIAAMTKKYKPQKPTYFEVGNVTLTDPLDKANAIADLYEKTFTCKERQKRNTKYILPIAMALAETTNNLVESYNREFNLNELEISLRTLKMTIL